jgi:hypothetical protein
MFRRILTAAAALAVLTALPAVAGGRTYAVNCTRPVFKPRTIVVACADGNRVFTSLKWGRWATRSAAGHGRAEYNDCNPVCATGHVHRVGTSVTLSRPVRCRHVRIFTRLHYVLARNSPGLARRGTFRFRCRNIGG